MFLGEGKALGKTIGKGRWKMSRIAHHAINSRNCRKVWGKKKVLSFDVTWSFLSEFYSTNVKIIEKFTQH
jgi:hypothetical protein